VQFGAAITKGSEFSVGVTEKKGAKPHGEGPMTVAQIALMQEYGLGVPERSFLRSWVDENQAMIQEDFRKATAAVLRLKMTFEQAVNILGTKYAAMIQKKIVERIPPKNADSTIASKGSDVPLIDTGVLRASISYQLQRRVAARAKR
jgi:hypothetical protein